MVHKYGIERYFSRTNFPGLDTVPVQSLCLVWSTIPVSVDLTVLVTVDLIILVTVDLLHTGIVDLRK